MDGLEAVELNFSDTINDAEIFRLDAEHYKKEYLGIKRILGNHECVLLSELVVQTISTGHTPSMANEKFYGGDIKFIKTDNLRDNFIKPEFNHYLSDLGNQEIKRTQLQVNDIIVTIIGATQAIIGRATKINEEILPANINQNIALIRVDSKKIVPDYVNIYLNSFYGRNYLYYLSRQTEQVNLNCEELGRLQIPIFSNDFQIHIETLVKSAYQKLEESKKLYSEAEELLLEELGLNDFTPSNECVAVKSFSESFGMSGRLDAEYYQLKYDDIIERIKSYRGGYSTVSEVCTLNDTNFTPNDNEIYNYIELSNIGLNGEIKGCMREKGADLPTRARRKVNTGQVIVSSIEGSLQSIAIVSAEYNKALCSTGFYAINSKQINSETLLVLLKNEAMQAVLKKGCSGTILTAIGKDEFLSIPLPLIDEKVQQIIAEKISESFTLRAKSKRLLEEAKTAVERAIEQGETI
ncbi:MAG: restriction endonuclease subunit S [Sulfuricurvum sp.]|uniref:restriction endonuclease subunit S n=1 Tax=Sulfuricurvum sp. TaxID=2025608 RepID=UPI0025E4FCBE|nr:restriction endonuclease subunit S [Sulfuricurvum sp.]MCI4405954.1 restriction endonuclease subunit S [Sulfuricurvum sp.]